MTRQAIRAGLTENDICSALMEARGDIFVTSGIIGCSVRELDSYIRSSESIQAFVSAIGRVKCDPEYDRFSSEQFEERLVNLTRSYKLDALEALHELTTMPITESAAFAQVKLQAAIQLKGMGPDGPKSGGSDLIFQELNQLYQISAPRIKSVRVAQIEFDEGNPSSSDR